MITKNFFLLLLLSGLQINGTVAQAPADHLVPPPAPARVQKSIPQFIPLPGENPAAPFIVSSTQESPGFMQRIVQWFGYGKSNPVSNTVPPERPRELPQQQSQASYYQPQYKELPNGFQYHRPKAPCNPCNKIPWLPMFQQPLLQGQRLNNNLQILGQLPNLPPQPQPPYQTQSSSIATPQYQLINQPHVTQQLPQYVPNYDSQNFHVQRAVKFNYPSPNSQNLQFFTQQQLTPIPVPNLSATPIPPLFNAVPFHQPFNGQQQYPQQINHNLQSQAEHQQLQQHFEHLSQPSEIQAILPTQIPANDLQESQQSDRQNAFEVVQSVPVTDFVSSIDYPVKVIQSEVIDLSKLQNVEQPSNHNFEQNVEKSKDDYEYPKLIELGSYEPQSTTHTHRRPHHQLNPHLLPDHIVDPIIVHNHNVPDNLVAASSHNITIRHENHLDIGNYPVNHQTLKPIIQEPFLPTILPSSFPAFSSTFRPDYSTEQSQYTTIVDIQPSLETASAGSEFFKKDRGTPKRLLDAPILYNHNNINDNNALHASSPRPFTRDPSDLHIRSSTFTTPTTGRLSSSLASSTPWAFSPTPTSTYSALDASGQWAGISPPAQFQPIPTLFEPPPLIEKRPKQVHQIIIPYTTKHKPQPFKPRDFQQQSTKPTDNRYSGWANSHEHQEYHEEQESKLVTATQATDGPTKKTTKYLTKILASNIRDLLKKEHEVKNKSFGVDLNQLQKNIDDWTEQEFTSLTHKSSTVSLRGRSKNIPHEYLTTTPSLRQAKTTRFFETTPEPTTGISGDLQSLLLNNDFYSSHSIEDNNIEESKRIISTKGSKTTRTPTTTTTTTTTTTNQPNTQPFYIRNVKLPTENEVWQKVKISISPLTKEKIYVVTPQPRFQVKTTTISGDNIGTFKSPRFLVRPTPASSSSSSGTSNHLTSTTTDKPKPKPYSPELFGLMGISAYIPGAPVDVLDGHSRVITVVTPTPHARKRSIEKQISTEANNLTLNRS